MKKFCLVDNGAEIGRKNRDWAPFAFGYDILHFMEVHFSSIFSQILAVIRASSRARWCRPLPAVSPKMCR